MMELLLDPQAWIAFLTLTALELVLGIDTLFLHEPYAPERK
jgi:predicted tellurium resistance membrane protein TerC